MQTMTTGEDYLRGKYGAYRGHPEWRSLEEAFNAGKASQDAEIARLQKALNFWLPCVPNGPEEIAKRVADDAMMLKGCEAPDEQSAEDLGWLSLNATRRYSFLRGRALHDACRGGVFAVIGKYIIVAGKQLDEEIDAASLNNVSG